MDLLGYLGSFNPLSLKPFRLWNFAGVEQGNDRRIKRIMPAGDFLILPEVAYV
jgi:hypothetical protein